MNHDAKQCARQEPQNGFGFRRMHSICVAAGYLSLGLYSATFGAPPEGSGKEFRASVLDMSSQTQRLTVPLHRSVAVETTVEVARADVIARQIADVQVVSPTRLLITGQSYGTTNVILMGPDNKQNLFEITVELDLQRLNDSLKTTDPLGKVQATSMNGHIVLTGVASSTERARRIVELSSLFLPASQDNATSVQNHLEVAGVQQVSLRCVVAEVNRSSIREMGINGFLAGDNVRDMFLVNQLGGINPANIGAAADANVTGRIPFLTGADGIPLTATPTLSLGFPRVQMQMFIRAMADNSLLQILAEPNLVSTSGETASFLAGGEFPIPVPQGNQQVTIEFREFGVRLNFTPIVEGQQRIRLRIAPEVSELDFRNAVQITGYVVPGLSTRSAETTVEVGSGQTIAIAGLLSEQVRGIASRVPALGDVPVLGALFRSTRFQRSLTELVILVTPELVAPLDSHQPARIPGEDRVDPNDFDLYALGLLDGDDLELGRRSHDAKHATSAGKPSAKAIRSQPDELSIHGPWGHAGLTTLR